MIFAPALLFSQVGYLGKRNLVSLDLLDLAKETEFNLNYEFCLGRGTAFNLELLKGIKSTQENYPLNYNNFNYDLKFNNFGWGLSFLTYSSYTTNMQAPLGYYLGYGYAHNNAQMTVHITGKDNPFPAYKNSDPILPLKSNVVKMIFGRKGMIKKFFTFDIALEIGYEWGRITNNDPKNFSMTYSKIYPTPLDKMIFTSIHFKSYDQPEGISKFDIFYLNPVIRIGYMF